MDHPERASRPALPLTLAQQALDQATQRRPEVRFTTAFSCRLRGDLDPGAFREAVEELVDRHDALRLRVTRPATGPAVQEFREPPAAAEALRYQRVAPTSPERFTAFAARLATLDAVRPWDLATAPPFRFRLLRHEPGHHAFLATLSLHAADGAARRILLRELWSGYRRRVAGLAAPARPPAGSFAEAVRRHHAGSTAAELDRLEHHWSAQLDRVRPCAFTPPESFAPDRPAERDAPGEAFAPRTHRFAITGAPLAALRTSIRDRRSSELQLAYGALAAALFRHTPQESVTISCPVDTRRTDERDVLGMFSLNLPLVVPRTPTGPALLETVRHGWFDLLKHRHVTPATVTATAPRSAGWLGASWANNVRLNYTDDAPGPARHPAADLARDPVQGPPPTPAPALHVEHDSYRLRTVRASAPVHLRVANRPDRLVFALTLDSHRVPDRLAHDLTHALDTLTTA
ncbi:condensation domain-containing protein [Kitasatospora purpeofusca]|uniref:condensation domain-containing protein n=1 Tax=Kitasatospora purpeofusca TaxID=67352 RepID=UPI00380A3AFD